MKMNQRGFGIAELFIAVIVVGIIGGSGWLVYSRLNAAETKTDETNLAQSSQQKDSTILQPEQITEKIKSTVSSKFTLLDMNDDVLPEQGEMKLGITEASPPYKVDGYKFYTDYEGGSSLSMLIGPFITQGNAIPSVNDKNLRTEVVQILQDFGLTQSGTYGSTSNGDGVGVYEGKGLVCTSTLPDTASEGTNVTCGNLARYPDEAARILPLARAIPSTEDSTFFSRLKIEDSSVDGYMRAEIGRGSIESPGGSVALLYKKGNGSWIYISSHQELPSCDEFSSEDLRNAFKGEECSNISTGETVKL